MKKVKTAVQGLLIFFLVILSAANAAATLSVYGVVHTSLDYLTAGNDGALNLSSNSSRFGIRGAFNLSSNLSAIYQLESTVILDTSGGTLVNRDSFAGLSGGFGTVRLGYFDTPVKAIRNRTDLFGDQVGDNRNATFGNDLRFRNSLGYTTPKIGPLVLDSQLSVDQNAAASTLSNDDWAASLSISLIQDDFYVGAGYEIRNNAGLEESVARAGLSLNFDPIRLTGFVQYFSGTFNALTVGGGVGLSIGDILLKTQVYAAIPDGDDNNGFLVAAGLDYKLSRNVTLLAAFAIALNDDLAVFSSSGAGHGAAIVPAAGNNQSSTSFGIRISF
jgi:predicted porin